jgi:hypothetical protein
VLRRCTASMALLSVALIGAWGPSRASAASIVSEKVNNGVEQIVPDGTPGATKFAYYSLKNTRSSTINDQIGFTVDPSGSVVQGNLSATPLSVVGGSTGFNAANLSGVMGQTSNGTQGLVLDFGNESFLTPPYNNPLSAGGVANFKLSLDPSYSLATTPTLTLQSPYTDLTLTSYTPAFVDAAPGALNTPEPVSLVLWSALAGAGLLRARAFRRSRRAAPALD